MPEGKNETLRLFKEIQLGSKAAFDELFELYHDKLLFFARQYTRHPESAEEITSEFFVRIWLKREELSKVLNPEAYLYVCTKNACLNMIRQDKKRYPLLTEQLGGQAAGQPIGDRGLLLEDRELEQMLDLAVEALPEQRRLIFRLVKEQGLKNQTAAEILGISVRTVENQLYKAIKTLADALSGYLGYHPQATRARKRALSKLSLLFFL